MAKVKGKENSFFTGMESFEEPAAPVSVAAEIKAEANMKRPKEEEKTEESVQERTVPLPKVNKKRERKTVRVPLLVTPSVASGMKIIAAREDRSVNDIVNELMKANVEKNL